MKQKLWSGILTRKEYNRHANPPRMIIRTPEEMPGLDAVVWKQFREELQSCNGRVLSPVVLDRFNTHFRSLIKEGSEPYCWVFLGRDDDLRNGTSLLRGRCRFGGVNERKSVSTYRLGSATFTLRPKDYPSAMQRYHESTHRNPVFMRTGVLVEQFHYNNHPGSSDKIYTIIIPDKDSRSGTP